ncbi:hypothetical protein INR49_031562 [Caranx melampygus]|nr:hypothetical protein INR49_031562 [Caranx melampygus]
MDYEHKAEKVADCLQGYKRDESGWKVCKKSNDVVVSWRPSSEFPGNVYRGEGIIGGSLEKVWECLKPVPSGHRVKWDNNVKKFELLEQVTEDISICRTVTPSAAMEPNKTQVFSFFQTDLGGFLPRSVVDSFFPSSMAEFYSNLAKAVKSLKDL